MTALYLLRHGETEWSRTGRHTSTTDLPLTPAGEHRAALAGRLLAVVRGDTPLALVASSPRTRALHTARLAGLSPDPVTEDLAEWNYGEYEGLSTPQIRQTVPGWTTSRARRKRARGVGAALAWDTKASRLGAVN